MITEIEGILIEDREQCSELRLYEKSNLGRTMLEWIVLELRDNISDGSWTETKMFLSVNEAKAIKDYLSRLLEKDVED